MGLDRTPQVAKERFLLQGRIFQLVLEIKENGDQQPQHESRRLQRSQEFSCSGEAHQIEKIENRGKENRGLEPVIEWNRRRFDRLRRQEPHAKQIDRNSNRSVI